jgi:hypothetical protein
MLEEHQFSVMDWLKLAYFYLPKVVLPKRLFWNRNYHNAHCTNGGKRNAYRLLVRKPEGKRPLGRPRCRWIDKIKMDLLEIGLSVVDWIGLAQDR